MQAAIAHDVNCSRRQPLVVYLLISLYLAYRSQRRAPKSQRCRRTGIAFLHYFGLYFCIPLFVTWNISMGANSIVHLWGR